jgi:hypothetical protein
MHLPDSPPAPILMPTITAAVGALLVALGLYAYTGSVTRSPMTLIPAFVGGTFVLLGLLARTPAMKRHAMHAGAALALLGALAGIGPLAMGGTRRFPPLMIQATTGMMVLCAILLALMVRSFVQARRARRAG